MHYLTETITSGQNTHVFNAGFNYDDDSFRLNLTTSLEKDKMICFAKFTSSTKLILPLTNEEHRADVHYD